MPLPIQDVESQIIKALREQAKLVIIAPPGAGKTTRVPLALFDAGFARKGRIVMLEPRRIAARASAMRMAQQLGEKLGQTVGLRMRGETKSGANTKIEVITEGVLTRMLHSDPELSGISTIIFDEFHERSLHADTGLAMAMDVAGALRDDLRLVVMSATLASQEIVDHLNAPLVVSQGRSYDVDIRYIERAPPPKMGIEAVLCRELPDLVSQESGGVLVFLPGEREIKAAHALLRTRLSPQEFTILPLYAALGYEAQRAALEPLPEQRKVVLATSIAETSITIPDIRIVVDCGLTRSAEFDIKSQMNRLVTERVSKAEADQRAGRAGRVAMGVALRLWPKGAHGGLIAHRPPEIMRADIAGLVLDQALWTGMARGDMPWLTPPPEGRMQEAIHLLERLGALDHDGRPTLYAQDLAHLPLHPRLAHALIQSGKPGAETVALLASNDPLRGSEAGCDGLERLRQMKRAKGPAWDSLRQEVRHLQTMAPSSTRALSAAQICALAYPDQIGQRRAPQSERYLLSNGKGVRLPTGDVLVKTRYIALNNHNGQGVEPQVRMAFALEEEELREVLGHLIARKNTCRWSRRHRKIEALEQECLGAVVLHEEKWDTPSEATLQEAYRDMIAHLGLPWDTRSQTLAARLKFWDQGPSMAQEDLINSVEEWLFPYLINIKTAEDFSRINLAAALKERLDWPQQQAFEKAVPANYQTPLGRKITIDYSGEHPQIALRLQELFGETRHPQIAGRPLRLVLLSPAQRPVQTTLDLPGFWTNSYQDVRKDMRGRYPKHPWPEDPRAVPPTLRAKPRKT